MALPQQITERLNRVPSRTPGVSGQLVMLTGLLFLLSLASYVGLKYGYLPYLNSGVDNLKDEIKTFAAKIPPETQIEILNLHSQLTNLQTLLAKHTLTSKFFEWFEKNTQVNVYYQNFDFNLATGNVSLRGVAKTVNDVGEQLLIFNQLPEVKKISIGSVDNAPDGLWQFNLNLAVTPNFFLLNSPVSSSSEKSP